MTAGLTTTLEVTVAPRCGHKNFTRTTKMNGDIAVLQCRQCRQDWCTNLKERTRCERHFNGGCDDPNCEHTHVFRRKNGRRPRKKNGFTAAAVAAATESETAETISGNPSEEYLSDGPPQLLDDF